MFPQAQSRGDGPHELDIRFGVISEYIMKNLIRIDLHCFVFKYSYSFVLNLRFSVALLQYVTITYMLISSCVGLATSRI